MTIIKQAAVLNNAFVVWRMEYQGIPASGAFPHPDARDYAMPTDDQAQQFIELLRSSL